MGDFVLKRNSYRTIVRMKLTSETQSLSLLSDINPNFFFNENQKQDMSIKGFGSAAQATAAFSNYEAFGM
jgi:hypothetical protein